MAGGEDRERAFADEIFNMGKITLITKPVLISFSSRFDINSWNSPFPGSFVLFTLVPNLAAYSQPVSILNRP